MLVYKSESAVNVIFSGDAKQRLQYNSKSPEIVLMALVVIESRIKITFTMPIHRIRC